METVATNTEVPFTLKALVVGLQATTIAVLALTVFAFLLAVFWKNSILQIVIQAFAKVIPTQVFFDSKRMQKVKMASKIHADHCSICYCDINKEVISNCGHVFCGDCLIKFWQSKKKEKLSCPLCRSDVDVLSANFNVNNVCPKDQETKNIVENVTRYNISCSTCPTTVLHLILGSPSSMKIFLESLPSRQGFSSVFKGIFAFLYALAMLIYMVSPTDMTTDNESDNMFGWIDDSASLIYLFLYVVILFIMVA